MIVASTSHKPTVKGHAFCVEGVTHEECNDPDVRRR